MCMYTYTGAFDIHTKHAFMRTYTQFPHISQNSRRAKVYFLHIVHSHSGVQLRRTPMYHALCTMLPRTPGFQLRQSLCLAHGTFTLRRTYA
jgi:hypothetical protein